MTAAACSRCGETRFALTDGLCSPCVIADVKATDEGPRHFDRFIYDDPVTLAREIDDVMRADLSAWADLMPRPKFTRSGEYRNRFGERVTWQSTEDGSMQMLQTWPEEAPK